MTTVCDLSKGKCKPCEGGVPPLSDDEAAKLLSTLEGTESVDSSAEESIAVCAMLDSIRENALAACGGERQITLECAPGLRLRGPRLQIESIFANLVAAVLAHWFGDAGALVAAGAAGFADAHAAAASVAQVFNAGQVGIDVAANGVLVGFATNTVSKSVVAFGTGGRRFALHLLPGLIAMLVSFALVLLM